MKFAHDSGEFQEIRMEGLKVLRRRGSNDQAVVFLHGFGGDMTVWDELVSHFTDQTIYLVDLRGHGRAKRSKEPGFYAIERIVADIERLCWLERKKKIILVGHCFGGMIALTYTQKHPKSVNRLVLINAADGLPWWIAFIPQPTLLRWFENHLVSVIPDIGVTSYRDFRKFAHSSDFNLTRIAGDMMHTHLHAYVSILRNTLEFDFRLKNPKVMPETLIIRGNRDRVIPGYLTANLIQRLPMARVRTLDAGHLIPITNQEQLVKILEVYLSNTK